MASTLYRDDDSRGSYKSWNQTNIERYAFLFFVPSLFPSLSLFFFPSLLLGRLMSPTLKYNEGLLDSGSDDHELTVGNNTG